MKIKTETMTIWDWENFGLGFQVTVSPMNPDYKFHIDIFILWFNIWIRFKR